MIVVKKVIFGAFMMLLAYAVNANTRMIRHLDILDAWKYNYNASHWIELGNMQQGMIMYGEVGITITQLPSRLVGADWIQTAYGSKNFVLQTPIATFQLTGDAEVFIIHASSVTTKPLWLKGYTKTNQSLQNSDGSRYDVLVKNFKKGDTVMLGSNGNRDLPMYIVAVKPVGIAPALPQPTGKIFDIVTYGAKGDDKTINTASIQKAIDACAKAGGGSVLIHDGIYRTGTLQLKSNVSLFVQAGSVLRGSPNHNDFYELKVDLPGFRSNENQQFLYAHKQHHITIEGGGTIDGYAVSNGWPWRAENDDLGRPRLLRVFECKNILVRDLTLMRSANWTQYFEGCDSLQELNVRVRCYTGMHNLDGIDISGCSNVVMRNYYAITGDDAVCIKAMSDKPTKNLDIQDVQARYSNCHAVKIGTETHSAVKNVVVKNVVAQSRYGAAIESVDGAAVENIRYENFHFSECGVPIFIRLGQRGRMYEGGPNPVPLSTMKDITVKNIRNDGMGYVDTRGGPGVGSVISGTPNQYIENLTLEDCDFLYYGSLMDSTLVYRNVPENEKDYPEFNILGTCPAYGLYTRHVKGVTYKNIRLRLLHMDVRPAIVMDDVKGYSLADISAEGFTITQPGLVWHKQDGILSPQKPSAIKTASKN